MSIFYDVLTEKTAEKEEQERSTAKGLALGTAGAALGVGTGRVGKKALGGVADALYKRSLKPDLEGAKKVYDAIDREKFDVINSSNVKAYFESGESPFERLEELDETFGIKRDETGKAVRSGREALYLKAKGGKRGVIYVPLTRDLGPTGLLHELGHGTGGLGLGGGKAPKWQAAVTASSNLRGLGSVIGAGVGGASALRAGTREELDRASTTNNAAFGAAGVIHAPRLLEEARANIRAIGLGKKLGVPARKRELAAAMGTYLAGAAGSTLLPWYANKKIIDYKREKTASMNGPMMFYEVLMEKSAQRQEREEQQQPRLSMGQKAGIGVAGAVGGLGAGTALGLGAMANRRLGEFFAEGTKRDREARAAAKAQYESVEGRMKDITNTLRNGSLEDLRALQGNSNVPAEGLDALSKTIKAKEQQARFAPDDLKWSQAGDDAAELSGNFEDILKGKTRDARNAFTETLSTLTDRINKRNRVIGVGSVLGGGLAAGYGAKKLFDHLNQRKQQDGV